MTTATEPTIMRLIAEIWADHHTPRDMPALSGSTTWRDIGFCMMDVACLICAAEEAFGVDLPTKVEECDTIAALCGVVDEARALCLIADTLARDLNGRHPVPRFGESPEAARSQAGRAVA